MSSATTSSAPPPAPTLPPVKPARREVTLISHSMLFYWWPIWALGFAMALVTYYEDHRLAIVPDGSILTVKGETDKTVDFQLSVPKPLTKSLVNAEKASTSAGELPAFKTRVSQKAWMGPVFCVALLLNVVITSVPLRGLWSFLVIMVVVIMVLLVSIMHAWDSILAAVFNLHIYINMAGYLFIASAMFVLWAVSVFIFDQRTYMTVEPGQIRICEHVGASIRTIDASGVEFEKQRDDIFRHWLLGFFSGDLIIRLPDRSQIRLPNVLRIGWILEDAQKLLREKEVTPHS